MEKKYEILTSHTKRVATTGGHTIIVSQIKALRDIPKVGVKKGDLGGHVWSEESLSHDDSSWVFQGSSVLHQGRVRENAVVFGNSVISTRAVVSGNCRIEDSEVQGESVVEGEVHVDRSTVSGNSLLSGTIAVKHSTVYGVQGIAGEITRSTVKSHEGRLNLESMTIIIDSNLGIYDEKPVVEVEGEMHNVVAEKLVKLQLSGAYWMKNVTFQAESELVINLDMNSKDESVIEGVESGCMFEKTSLYLLNSAITGNVTLKGSIALEYCSLSNMCRIENETAHDLDLIDVSMSELGTLRKTSGSGNTRLRGMEINSDFVMVC